MSLFGKSALEKRIEALTDENLRDGGDMAGNLHLADTINSAPNTDDVGRDALKYIQRRLKAKSSMGRVQQHALVLLDVLMKNTHSGFHLAVSRDTLKTVAEVATNKSMPNSVRDQALQLIESWHEAFSRPVVADGGGSVATRPEFSKTYFTLRASGVEFPPRDMTSLAPVVTPNRNAGVVGGVNVLAQQQQQQRFGGQGQAGPYGEPLPPAQAGGGGGGGQQVQYGVARQPSAGAYGLMQPQQYAGPNQHLAGLAHHQPILVPQQMPQQQPQQYHQHFQQQQQPPPQQQQQQQQQQRARGTPARPALTPEQQREYVQYTFLSSQFVDKVKRETRLAFDWLLLLRDLCGAADSPAALKQDELARTLATSLLEVRTRYTKLVLEVGDLALNAAEPQATATVEYVLDLAIRMIEQCRVMLDYHKASCEGIRELTPPDIVIHRSLQSAADRRPSPSPAPIAAAASPVASPVAAAAAAGAASPVSAAAPGGALVSSPPRGPAAATQQLFDLDAFAGSEEEEKRVAASVFSQARSGAGGGGQAHSSPSPAAAALTATGTEQSSRTHVSPDGFAPAQSFAPVDHWPTKPQQQQLRPQPLSEEQPLSSAPPQRSPFDAGSSDDDEQKDSSSSSSTAKTQKPRSLAALAAPTTMLTPFDEALPAPSSSASATGAGRGSSSSSSGGGTSLARSQSELDQSSRAEAAAHAFDLLAPMRIERAQASLRPVGAASSAAGAAAASALPPAAVAAPVAPSSASAFDFLASSASNGDGGGGGGGDDEDPGSAPSAGVASSATGADDAAAAASLPPGGVGLPSDESFFEDMAALTLPQANEGKEGEA